MKTYFKLKLTNGETIYDLMTREQNEAMKLEDAGFYVAVGISLLLEYLKFSDEQKATVLLHTSGSL